MTDVSGSLSYEVVLVDEIAGCESEESQDELADEVENRNKIKKSLRSKVDIYFQAKKEKRKRKLILFKYQFLGVRK